MTNKEKLEIIDKKLDEFYEFLKIGKEEGILFNDYDYKQLTQTIYNLESTKLLLEPIENNLGLNKENNENYNGVW